MDYTIFDDPTIPFLDIYSGQRVQVSTIKLVLNVHRSDMNKRNVHKVKYWELPRGSPIAGCISKPWYSQTTEYDNNVDTFVQ